MATLFPFRGDDIQIARGWRAGIAIGEGAKRLDRLFEPLGGRKRCFGRGSKIERHRRQRIREPDAAGVHRLERRLALLDFLIELVERGMVI